MVCLFLQCVLAEVLAIFQGAIRLNVVSQQICAVPIIDVERFVIGAKGDAVRPPDVAGDADNLVAVRNDVINRSEEHTSELQSRSDLVCRLLLEKKKKH